MEEPIRVTVYCFIEKKEKVLLTEDKGKPGWKLPGGELAKGELILAAAKREVKEETGLDIEITGLVGIHEYIKEDGEHRMRVYTTARLLGGEERINKEEVSRAVWFRKEDLAKLRKADFYLRTYYLAVKDYLGGKIHPITILSVL